MASINNDNARQLLDDCLGEVENGTFDLSKVTISPTIIPKVDALFVSKTQSYREVLLGSSVARHEDKGITLSKPYVKQGADAYNARSFDEDVINPFLQHNEIPSSKGPFLATFRRNVVLDRSLSGQRDAVAYLAFVDCLEYLQTLTDYNFITYLLHKFIELRESSKITVAKIKRLSVQQITYVLNNLLGVRTGGLGPVLVTVALLNAKSKALGLNWTIDFQDINQADQASGASGDITVKDGKGNTVMVLEVTERPIDATRVTSTFNTKIVKQGILDYWFIYKGPAKIEDTARAAAEQYFARGHDVNIAHIMAWVMENLSTIGPEGREIFLEELTVLLQSNATPSMLKVSWNKIIQSL